MISLKKYMMIIMMITDVMMMCNAIKKVKSLILWNLVTLSICSFLIKNLMNTYSLVPKSRCKACLDQVPQSLKLKINYII